MIACKNCPATHTVKNGFVRDRQRDQGYACGYHVGLGDARPPHPTAIQKAWRILLHALGKASLGLIAKLLGISRTTAAYWMRDAAAQPEDPTIEGNRQAMACDAMWHLLQAKQERLGLSKRWIVAQGALGPGCLGGVVLPPCHGSMPQATISSLVAFIQTTGMRLLRWCPRPGISLGKPIRPRWQGTTPIRDTTSHA
jgi:hypothetical protein